MGARHACGNPNVTYGRRTDDPIVASTEIAWKSAALRNAAREPRRVLDGEAPRSEDGKPEQRFSGLRSSFQIE